MKQILQKRNMMRSILSSTILAAACTFTACTKEEQLPLEPTETLEASSENGAIIEGQYIIVFKQDENLRLDATATYAQRVAAVRWIGQELLAANGVKNIEIERAYGKALHGIVAKLSDGEVVNLRRDARIAYIEPDRIIALGKPGSGSTGGGSSTQSLPWGISRVGYATGSEFNLYSSKTAWVIDSGIDLDHPDLHVDASRSRTFVSTGSDSRTADDGNGHGTHVAGTIGARNNGYGVIGVAPDATVVAIKVLNSRGSGSYSGVIAGLDYVTANGKAGDVANMSLGGPVSNALDAAVLRAAEVGIKITLAAGNESAHASESSPARVNHDNVYTISAMDISDVFAYFSNYGNPPVDFCAPGVSIRSTWKGGAYATTSGTSMAAPHVAGLLLLGSVGTDGRVTGDPDGTADVIAHR